MENQATYNASPSRDFSSFYLPLTPINSLAVSAPAVFNLLLRHVLSTLICRLFRKYWKILNVKKRQDASVQRRQAEMPSRKPLPCGFAPWRLRVKFPFNPRKKNDAKIRNNLQTLPCFVEPNQDVYDIVSVAFWSICCTPDTVSSKAWRFQVPKVLSCIKSMGCADSMRSVVLARSR